MAELLNIGTSGLISLQRALATTSNNIVNANTEGYSRQLVTFDSLPTQRLGPYFLGSGVTIGGIERAYNEHLVEQKRNLTSSHASNDARSEMLTRLDNLIANPDNSVSMGVQQFFSAVQALSANPSGLPEREVVLAEAKTLQNQVTHLDENLRQINEEVNGRLQQMTREVNSLADRLAQINTRLIETSGSASEPGELMDQRDVMLNQLSELLDVRVIDEGDSSVSVLFGNGQPLVTRGTAFSIGTVRNEFDGDQLDITYEPRSGVATVVSDTLSGGAIGGLLDFRDNSLTAADDKLGLMVAGLAATVNQAHRLGLDVDGDPGQTFFTDPTVTVLPSSNNGGTGSVAVTLDDVGQLEPTSYSLRFDGANWALTRQSDQTTQTGAGPFVVDGMTVSVAGIATAGDEYLIAPTRNTAASFDVVLARGADIAAAVPVRSQSIATNAGDSQIEQIAVGATAGLPLTADIVLTFDPDALGAGVPGFTVTGSTVTAIGYDPVTEQGKTFSLPNEGDISFTVTGDPAAGDQMRIQNNSGAASDNRNLLSITSLQTDKVLQNGNTSLQGSYSNLIAQVGVQTRQAESGAQTDQLLLDDVIAANSSISGVNLDEEAARLLRYQQTYQAAAQLVAVADSMFQTLLGATGR